MTITKEQLDELERTLSGLRDHGYPQLPMSVDVATQFVAIARAAIALVSQPMLVKGDAATWGDVAQSHSEGPRLLRDLMHAVNGESP